MLLVLTIRASQEAIPANIHCFWHSALKRSHPKHGLSSLSGCSGPRATSSFLSTVHGETGLCESPREGLGPLYAGMAGQACGAVSLPSPPWLLCRAGQQHRAGKQRVLAVGWASLHLPDTVGQEHAKRALETTQNRVCVCSWFTGWRKSWMCLQGKPPVSQAGDPPWCRCGSGASWRAAPKVLSESNVDRTNESTSPTLFSLRAITSSNTAFFPVVFKLMGTLLIPLGGCPISKQCHSKE